MLGENLLMFLEGGDATLLFVFFFVLAEEEEPGCLVVSFLGTEEGSGGVAGMFNDGLIFSDSCWDLVIETESV